METTTFTKPWALTKVIIERRTRAESISPFDVSTAAAEVGVIAIDVTGPKLTFCQSTVN